MSHASESGSGTDRLSAESFAYKYRRLATPAAQRVRAVALGSDVPNGYTSVAQADRLAERLRIGPGERLLDLGSGRGWPGTHIAEQTGCGLVVSDLPLAALRTAAVRHSTGRSVGFGIVCADGARLPFRAASFDAASHTDVLC